MIRIGVLGAGHLGKIHIKLLKTLTDQFELVGVYDRNEEHRQQVASEFGVPVYDSAETLLDAVDAVDIVTPTLAHHKLAVMAIRKFKHVFIEKPVTETYEQAKNLVALAREAGVRAMVGHVERYNPAVLALAGRTLTPTFIQIDRLAKYNPRGTDVSVVHDLMIHDIDLALVLAADGVKRVTGSAAAVVSPSYDIATARLEFNNGCVAHLNTSRVAFENKRQIQLFEPSGYYVLDLLNKAAFYHQLHPTEAEAKAAGGVAAHYATPEGDRFVSRQLLPVPEVNAIQQELADFGKAIKAGTPTPIPLVQAADALRVVEDLVAKIA